MPRFSKALFYCIFNAHNEVLIHNPDLKYQRLICMMSLISLFFLQAYAYPSNQHHYSFYTYGDLIAGRVAAASIVNLIGKGLGEAFKGFVAGAMVQ